MKLIATSLLKLTQLGKARYKPQSQWDIKVTSIREPSHPSHSGKMQISLLSFVPDASNTSQCWCDLLYRSHTLLLCCS